MSIVEGVVKSEQLGDWQALLDLLPAVADRATEHVVWAKGNAGRSLINHSVTASGSVALSGMVWLVFTNSKALARIA